jgi:predicted outer membrane repeat protein
VQDPGVQVAIKTLPGYMLAAGDVSIAGNIAVAYEDAINMKSLVQTFKIEGGDTRKPWGDGGGMWSIDDFKATLLAGVTFQGNRANHGGAVCLRSSSTLSVSYSTFSGNTAENNGGALSAFEGSVIAAGDSMFSLNSAGAYGGAIAAEEYSSAAVRHCTLRQNSASYGGGLASLEQSQMALEHCRAVDNTANVDGGGAVAAGESTVLVRSSFVGRNRALNGAGMAVVDDALLKFVGNERIEFSNNSAARDGGALLLASTALVSTETADLLITGNHARRGGTGKAQKQLHSYEMAQVLNCSH